MVDHLLVDCSFILGKLGNSERTLWLSFWTSLTSSADSHNDSNNHAKKAENFAENEDKDQRHKYLLVHGKGACSLLAYQTNCVSSG